MELLYLRVSIRSCKSFLPMEVVSKESWQRRQYRIQKSSFESQGTRWVGVDLMKLWSSSGWDFICFFFSAAEWWWWWLSTSPSTSRSVSSKLRLGFVTRVTCDFSFPDKLRPFIVIWPMFTAHIKWNSWESSEPHHHRSMITRSRLEYYRKLKARLSPTASRPIKDGKNFLICSSASVSAFSVSHSKVISGGASPELWRCTTSSSHLVSMWPVYVSTNHSE